MFDMVLNTPVMLTLWTNSKEYLESQNGWAICQFFKRLIFYEFVTLYYFQTCLIGNNLAYMSKQVIIKWTSGKFNKRSSPTQPKVIVLDATLRCCPWGLSPCKKRRYLFPEILMTKEPCNMIGREAQMVTPN